MAGALILIILGLDEGLKYYFITHQPNLTILNSKLAFSGGQTPYLIVGLALFALTAFLTRAKPRLLWFGLTLSIVTNLIDRLLVGGIIDYIRLGTLHFNLADLLICCFIASIILTVFKKEA